MTMIEDISRQLAIEAAAEAVLKVSADPDLPIAVRQWMDGYARGLLATRIRIRPTDSAECHSTPPPPPEAYPTATGLTPAGMPYPIGGIAGHALNEIAEGDGVLLPNTGDGPPCVCREYPGAGSALLYQRGHLPCRCRTDDGCQLSNPTEYAQPLAGQPDRVSAQGRQEYEMSAGPPAEPDDFVARFVADGGKDGDRKPASPVVCWLEYRLPDDARIRVCRCTRECETSGIPIDRTSNTPTVPEQVCPRGIVCEKCQQESRDILSLAVECRNLPRCQAVADCRQPLCANYPPERTSGVATAIAPVEYFANTQNNLRERGTPAPSYPAVDCPLGCGYWHAGETLAAGWQIVARHISVEHHTNAVADPPPEVSAHNAARDAAIWVRAAENVWQGDPAIPDQHKRQLLHLADQAVSHARQASETIARAIRIAAGRVR